MHRLSLLERSCVLILLSALLLGCGGRAVRDIAIGIGSNIGAEKLSAALENSGPSASISELRLEHNVYSASRKGVNIHFRLEVDDSKDRSVRVSAFVRHAGWNRSLETYLRDTDGDYVNSQGLVQVCREATPSHENSVWNEFTLFFPYDEMHVNPLGGVQDLMIELAVDAKSGEGGRLATDSIGFRFMPG